MKASPIQSVFNAGEFAPLMDARVDFDKYPAAVSRAKNMICLSQGGLTLRPGTRFIAPTKDGSARLIGFEPAAGAAYVVEAGDEYFRFFHNQGRIAVDLTDAAVTNGDFATNITGWTDSSTGAGAASHQNGAMQLAGTQVGFSGARQAISIGAGFQANIHVVRFRVLHDARASVSVRVGASSGAADLALAEGLGMGWHTVAFVPGAGTVHLEFRNATSRDVRLDDVAFISDAPMEITTPYALADVDAVRVAQSSDVLYLFHPDYPVHKLQRRGDAAWSVVRAFFADGPYGQINPGTDLAEQNLISSFDNGLEDWGQVVTDQGYVDFDQAQNVVFLRRHSVYNANPTGSAAIIHETSTPNDNGLHVLHFQIVGSGEIEVSVGTTSGADDIVTAADYQAGWYTISFTPGDPTFFVQFKGDQDLDVIGGVGAVFCYHIQARLLKPSGRTGSVTLAVSGSAADIFTAQDVGRLVRLEWPGREPGYGVITAYASPTSVTLLVCRKLGSDEPTETWRLGAWCDRNGYPATGTFFQRRLYAARTYERPQTVWGSRTEAFEDFRGDSWEEGASTVKADDAIDVTLSSKRVSPINWLVGTRRLLAGTASGNWAFESQGAALTPLDISAAQQTSVDCADIEPVQIDDVGLFVHRALRAVYDIGFSYEIEGFRAADLTILSEHINRAGIRQITYQAEPYSTCWVRLADGTLSCMAYKRAQGVVGWTPVSMAKGGLVDSIAAIPGDDNGGQVYPSGNRDELWLVVERAVDGNTVHYVEMMEGAFDAPNRAEYADMATFEPAMRTAQADAYHVDCGLTYRGAPVSVISGLDHLEGETVRVVADGAVHQDKIVDAGTINLDLPASVVHVGLGYDWIVRTLKWPYGAQAGTAVGKKKSINQIQLVLLASASFEYGTEVENRQVEWRKGFRKAHMPMGMAVPLYTGEVMLDLGGGYDTDPRIIMKGDLPLPFTLLAIVPEMKTNERL